MRRWRLRHPDYQREYNATYRKSHPRKPRNPAHSAVQNALKDGRLKRGVCSKCGAQPAHAHHYNGYAKEHYLDIVWLCRSCHRLAHSRA